MQVKENVMPLSNTMQISMSAWSPPYNAKLRKILMFADFYFKKYVITLEIFSTYKASINIDSR